MRGSDEREKQIARDQVASVVELGLDDALEVLAHDRVKPAEATIVDERHHLFVRLHRLVEDRADELQVRRKHRWIGAPSHLGTDRVGGTPKVVKKNVKELGLDRE